MCVILCTSKPYFRTDFIHRRLKLPDVVLVTLEESLNICTSCIKVDIKQTCLTHPPFLTLWMLSVWCSCCLEFIYEITMLAQFWICCFSESLSIFSSLIIFSNIFSILDQCFVWTKKCYFCSVLVDSVKHASHWKNVHWIQLQVDWWFPLVDDFSWVCRSLLASHSSFFWWGTFLCILLQQ
jgi:hypothetical protein